MEERKWYIFTFGYGQKYEGYFVKFYGTFAEARQQMFDRFGSAWAFQYTEDEWNKFDYPCRETELILDDNEPCTKYGGYCNHEPHEHCPNEFIKPCENQCQLCKDESMDSRKL